MGRCVPVWSPVSVALDPRVLLAELLGSSLQAVLPVFGRWRRAGAPVVHRGRTRWTAGVPSLLGGRISLGRSVSSGQLVGLPPEDAPLPAGDRTCARAA